MIWVSLESLTRDSTGGSPQRRAGAGGHQGGAFRDFHSQRPKPAASSASPYRSDDRLCRWLYGSPRAPPFSENRSTPSQ